MTSHGYIQHRSANSVEAFDYFCVETVACMIPYQQPTLSKEIDNFNISKITTNFEHQFTAPFLKHLHKLPLCTLSLLIFTTYTDNHVGKTL